jgi:hypothetical protein
VRAFAGQLAAEGHAMDSAEASDFVCVCFVVCVCFAQLLPHLQLEFSWLDARVGRHAA